MRTRYTAICFFFLWSMLGSEAEPRFGLYLVTKSTNDLQGLELAGSPLITEADIIEYNWTNHAMHITEEAAKRIPTWREVGTKGKPFVIVADGKRAYQGAFWAPISSLLCPYPTIQAFGAKPKTKLMIEPSHIGGGLTADADPRDNAAVRQALRDTGRLKEN